MNAVLALVLVLATLYACKRPRESDDDGHSPKRHHTEGTLKEKVTARFLDDIELVQMEHIMKAANQGDELEFTRLLSAIPVWSIELLDSLFTELVCKSICHSLVKQLFKVSGVRALLLQGNPFLTQPLHFTDFTLPKLYCNRFISIVCSEPKQLRLIFKHLMLFLMDENYDNQAKLLLEHLNRYQESMLAKIPGLLELNSVLILSCKFGLIHLVKFFIHTGHPENNWALALTVALRSRNYEIGKLLLADLRVNPHEGYVDPVTTFAYDYDDLELLVALLRNPNLRPSESKIFRSSIILLNPELFKVLLEDGRIDPSPFDNDWFWKGEATSYPEGLKLLLQDGRIDPAPRIKTVSGSAFAWSQKALTIFLLDARIQALDSLDLWWLSSVLKPNFQYVIGALLQRPCYYQGLHLSLINKLLSEPTFAQVKLTCWKWLVEKGNPNGLLALFNWHDSRALPVDDIVTMSARFRVRKFPAISRLIMARFSLHRTLTAISRENFNLQDVFALIEFHCLDYVGNNSSQ